MGDKEATRTFKFNAVRLMCAVVFLLFTFSWLYWFQGDLMAVAQHGLSEGKTHYDHFVGALIITGVLAVVHLIVYSFTRLARRSHALTYFPSFLLLAFVSSVSHPFSWKAWPWAAPLVLVVWIGVVIVAKKALPFDANTKQPRGIFSQYMWINLLLLTAQMLGVVALSNTNAVDHYRAHAEVALQKGDVGEALRVGKKSHETDASLTMLRAFALAREGRLADDLFSYELAGGSADLLPLAGSKSRLQLLADTTLWDFFGLRPDSLTAYGSRVLSVAQYLDSLQVADSIATGTRQPYVDYRLTGLLLDRQIDSFAVSLPRYYTVDADSLPRHYREALVLYQQQRDTLFIYNDSLMLLQWHNYHQYDSIYPRQSERKIRTVEEFHDTYWFYYFL